MRASAPEGVRALLSVVFGVLWLPTLSGVQAEYGGARDASQHERDNDARL
jgi:hypothetical protein